MAPAKRTAKLARPNRSAKAPPASAPRAGHREERRGAIIETAAELFAQLGYADCEVERVADALQIAKGTVYLYFPSKLELFFACVDWGMVQMRKAVESASAGVDEPFEKIGRAIRAYLRFFESQPQFVELMIQERAIFRDRKKSTYFEHRDAHRAAWRELYRQMVSAGMLRDDVPVERMLDTIGSLVYGTMFTNHFTGRRASPDEQYATLMESIFRGLLSDSRRKEWRLPAASGP